ncbi:PKD domain-containing protein [Flavobacterium sp.]|uniref:PKD domain-containing protein n=1 Tax=Flavobacterium sp. TaxID=239 RepID=UPI0011F86558|nr:PKD domain-containing protein [Flavobacterium sp.]RZJ70716.1 MAG: PKD domain-containing protein [Flavobacterium sp.]
MATAIKTHFDKKVIILFIALFIASGALLAFNLNSEARCLAKQFEVSSGTLKENELITFTDVTPGAYDWKWSFGDGAESSFRSKTTHAFPKAGKYKVKLVVNGSCKVEKELTILPRKEELNKALLPVFSAPAVVYQNAEVAFADATKHAKSWEWRFGDGTKIDATESHPKHTYRIPGEKVVSLVVNGDIKYVSYQKITVLPAKKLKKDWVKDRIARRSQARADAVGEYFEKIPEAPKRGPELDGIDENKLRSILLGVSEDKLSYANMTRYMCDDNLPLVQLRDGKAISLKELDKQIRNRAIKIRKLSLQKDKDNCVALILLDFKFRSLF